MGAGLSVRLIDFVLRYRSAGGVDIQLVFLAVGLEFNLPVRALVVVAIVVVDFLFRDGLSINAGVG